MRKLLCLTLPLFLFVACKKEEPSPYPDCLADEITPTGVQSGGCGNLFIYQFADASHAVTIAVDPEVQPISEVCQEFDLSVANPGVKVVLGVARSSPDSVYFLYCNDAVPINYTPADEWEATGGTLRFVTTISGSPICCQEPYEVSATLENPTFMNPADSSTLSYPVKYVWKDRRVGFTIP